VREDPLLPLHHVNILRALCGTVKGLLAQNAYHFVSMEPLMAYVTRMNAARKLKVEPPLGLLRGGGRGPSPLTGGGGGGGSSSSSRNNSSSSSTLQLRSMHGGSPLPPRPTLGSSSLDAVGLQTSWDPCNGSSLGMGGGGGGGGGKGGPIKKSRVSGGGEAGFLGLEAED